MKITCRNCDGEMETLEIKKFEINQFMDGGFEAKATELDDHTFLLFDERLGTVKIENTKITLAAWKIARLEILIKWLNVEIKKSKIKEVELIELVNCLSLIKEDIKNLSSQ